MKFEIDNVFLIIPELNIKSFYQMEKEKNCIETWMGIL
jgi:hypothetical protein